MKISEKLYRWQRTQEAWEAERNQAALLKAPLPKDPPELSRPVKVRVLKSFCIRGLPVQSGETVTVPWYDAQDLLARKRIEVIRD